MRSYRALDCPVLPRVVMGAVGLSQAQKRPEPLISLGFPAFVVPSQDGYMVEVGGIEPPSEGTPSPVLHA